MSRSRKEFSPLCIKTTENQSLSTINKGERHRKYPTNSHSIVFLDNWLLQLNGRSSKLLQNQVSTGCLHLAFHSGQRLVLKDFSLLFYITEECWLLLDESEQTCLCPLQAFLAKHYFRTAVNILLTRQQEQSQKRLTWIHVLRQLLCCSKHTC